MANQKEAPYLCHVFVCVNDRDGKRRSCADQQSPKIRETLKAQVNKRGWGKYVRVSQSGCMGLCSDGPNVILYPQKSWFSEVSISDIPSIVSKLEEIISKNT
jgi:(2Fe-2S) ferredoxin